MQKYSEPQNIEQEISNDEVWNRFAQSFSKIKMIEYLTSIFDIPCSLFVIRILKVSSTIKLAASPPAEHLKPILLP